MPRRRQPESGVPIELLAHLRALSPLVSNDRLTSDSGSMIPADPTDSRKLSPSTLKYDTGPRTEGRKTDVVRPFL